MEWPSKNVSPGGIFHSKKVKYSPENHQFIKLLNQESKFTMIDCRSQNYFLRNNKMQFVPKRSRSTTEENVLMAKRKASIVLIRPTTSKRRPRQAIVNSGVYQREKFKPLPNSRPDRPKEIVKLQEKMANLDGNEDCKKTRVEREKRRKTQSEEEPKNRFDQLVQEIEERQEFLNEMSKLGEKKKYETTINKEIQIRIREMERLNLK